MSGSSAIVARYKAELSSMLVSLVLLGVAWGVMGLRWELVTGVIICVVGAPLFPTRYSWLASLIGFGGLAALAYFYFGSERIGFTLAAAGLILAAMSYFSKGRL